jgi:hypothetical protein
MAAATFAAAVDETLLTIDYQKHPKTRREKQ